MWHWNIFRIPEEAPRKVEDMTFADEATAAPLLEAAE
jgi:hypothetical protein